MNSEERFKKDESKKLPIRSFERDSKIINPNSDLGLRSDLRNDEFE